MGLEKAIASGKEHRVPYRGAKSVSCSCRNHGTCEYCRNARLYNNKKRELASQVELDSIKEHE